VVDSGRGGDAPLPVKIRREGVTLTGYRRPPEINGHASRTGCVL